VLQQFLVRSGSCHPAVVEDHDLVRRADRREPVRGSGRTAIRDLRDASAAPALGRARRGVNYAIARTRVVAIGQVA
jgi:hypothetical protein